MIYYAVSDEAVVITDDYSVDEVKKNNHITNILKDFKSQGYKGYIRVFDMYNKFVCIVNVE